MQKKAISTAEAVALPPVLYRGSVKDVRGFAGTDHVLFEYSDRYSVFDWGEMPDLLEEKGEALALLTDCIYRRLEREGISTHGIGLVDASGASLAPGVPTRYWKVQACERRMPTPRGGGWDYAWYKSDEAHGFDRNLLIPLEVVFRLGVTTGSSFFDRATPEYLRMLGLGRAPVAGEMLERPVVEYFTKLEETDRFLSVAEAKELAGLSDAEERDLREQALFIASCLREWFAACGLTLWDGKFEFAFRPGRRLCLVDAIGPDEMRLTSQNGIHVSKEILRDHYRDSPWYKSLGDAKRLARERKETDWKRICKEELKAAPQELPEELKAFARDLYLALTNEFLASPVFSAPSLASLLKRQV